MTSEPRRRKRDLQHLILPAPINQPRPHAVFTAFMCAFVGSGLLISGANPGSIEDRLPPPFITLWGVMLAVGGALVLVAMFLPDRIWSLLLERLGWVLLGGMCLVYGAAVLLAFHLVALFPGALTIALGLASWWRVVQISHLMRKVHAAALAIDRRDQ